MFFVSMRKVVNYFNENDWTCLLNIYMFNFLFDPFYLRSMDQGKNVSYFNADETSKIKIKSRFACLSVVSENHQFTFFVWGPDIFQTKWSRPAWRNVLMDSLLVLNEWIMYSECLKPVKKIMAFLIGKYIGRLNCIIKVLVKFVIFDVIKKKQLIWLILFCDWTDTVMF